ncbi:multidrug effflux MFS transporter [Usitatibacter palustris]|uniref:Bcr/CflA family efflux transporter n=1 Tax=Usitatibacter palustris TaxID=2732487 RepID=A0A6M4HBU4_9PROT|nr:multidrug effflux MFS transporter [Usitatibacter palustris]QJR16545.1 Bicyclomycin resistance protein [Usitatibacter palustris]
MNPQKGTDSRAFRWGFAALLAALATIGPFSIDTYLPAFAGIEKSLGTTLVGMQQTLSAYLFAFGLMFLFHGALSDSFGRRPVILVALVVFTLGSVGAALAGSIHALVFWRVIQGLSVGAGMVVGRAMIRDLFEAEDAQRLMSLVTLFFGLAPAIAPIVGGLLFESFGWRSIFWFLAIVGVLLVAMSIRFLPETLAEDARQPFHPKALLAGYNEVGMSPRFIWLSLATGFNFNALFLYILSAPVFLGEHLKLGPQEYAWLFIPSILGIMTGSQLSGFAAGKLQPNQTVKRAYAFMAIAAAGNLVANLLAPPSLPWSIVPIFFYGIGTAMAMPSISLTTLDLFPTRRGMAASLQGFVSGMVNTLTAGVISLAVSHNPVWLAMGMMIMMLMGLASWTLYLRSARKHAEPPTVIRMD